MQHVATVPPHLAAPVAPRPHTGWSVVSAILVGAFVALDRMLEVLGR